MSNNNTNASSSSSVVLELVLTGADGKPRADSKPVRPATAPSSSSALTYASVVQQASEAFFSSSTSPSSGSVKAFYVQYVDEEGERITVSSDGELDEAVAVAQILQSMRVSGSSDAAAPTVLKLLIRPTDATPAVASAAVASAAAAAPPNTSPEAEKKDATGSAAASAAATSATATSATSGAPKPSSSSSAKAPLSEDDARAVLHQLLADQQVTATLPFIINHVLDALSRDVTSSTSDVISNAIEAAIARHPNAFPTATATPNATTASATTSKAKPSAAAGLRSLVPLLTQKLQPVHRIVQQNPHYLGMARMYAPMITAMLPGLLASASATAAQQQGDGEDCGTRTATSNDPFAAMFGGNGGQQGMPDLGALMAMLGGMHGGPPGGHGRGGHGNPMQGLGGLMNMLGGMGGMGALNGMGGAGNPFAAFAPPPNPATAPSSSSSAGASTALPEDTYKSQLSALESLGFTDAELNVVLLQEHKGNLQHVLDVLLSH